MIISVIGDAVYFLGELFHQRFIANEDHPIHSILSPSTIISLRTLERAVEIATSGTITLYDLLSEYIEVSKDTSSRVGRAESLGNHEYDPDNSFTHKLFNQLFNELQSVLSGGASAATEDSSEINGADGVKRVS